VIESLLNAGTDGRFLAVDIKDEYDADDMKVLIENDWIIRVSKEIEIEEASAESTGIAKFSGNGKKDFISTLEFLVRKEEYLKRFWLEIFNEMAREGKKITPVWVDKDDWKEMDIHSDKALIDHLLKDKNWIQ
jgi:choline kinase